MKIIPTTGGNYGTGEIRADKVPSLDKGAIKDQFEKHPLIDTDYITTQNLWSIYCKSVAAHSPALTVPAAQQFFPSSKDIPPLTTDEAKRLLDLNQDPETVGFVGENPDGYPYRESPGWKWCPESLNKRT